MSIQGGEKTSKTKSGTERDEDSSGNEGFWDCEKSCGQGRETRPQRKEEIDSRIERSRETNSGSERNTETDSGR